MSQKEWQRCLQQQLEPVLTAANSGLLRKPDPLRGS